MATDHHHSAFDQDDFDRYDTFEDPVVDTTNPDRNGFAGDFGRLLDQIRINNAASKLDDNVAVGEDRALNVTGNWVAVPHEELYASVHTNNNPAEAYSLAREWTQLGNMMAENSRVMDEKIRSTESGWVGPAAEVARQATLKLATWGGDAAQTSQYMGTRIADQGLAAERAKAAMPEPVQFDYEQMLRQGFTTGGLAGLNQAVVDVQMASAQARTAHAQAAQVMTEMESQSRSVDETTPRFVRPPEVTDGATSPMNGLMSPQTAASPRLALPNGQLTPAGFEGASLPTGGTAAAFAGGGSPAAFASGGVPGAVSGGAPDFSGMAAGLTGGSASGTSAQRSAGAYTPPKINVPDIDIGTSTAGYSPTTPVTNGHPGGTKFGSGYQAPDLTNLLPPSITGSKGRDSTNSPSYVPPKLPTGINPATGLPFTPEEIRRGVPSLRGGMPGIGGGSGGFGGASSGGAGGFGGAGASGGGFGRAGMPGMGASVGAVAAAEQAAARGAAGAMAGQAGAAGSPGMGGGGMGGAKGGGGDNDKEHRNKYATNEKVVEEPGRMVPSVIGEKSAKQLSEEQAG